MKYLPKILCGGFCIDGLPGPARPVAYGPCARISVYLRWHDLFLPLLHIMNCYSYLAAS
jgi:hypothetical protein